MNTRKLLAACAVSITAFAAIDAAAVPIVGLVNTGANSTAGQQDTNYSLTKTSGDGPAIGSYGYESAGAGFPFGPWLANSATSQWLTPLANAGQTFDANSAGIYTWTLQFDLTGYDPTSAFFGGRWATDNSGTILLNGSTLLNPSTGFTAWSSFSSTGGNFNAGLNTLQFVVTNWQQNGGNPTGLRVEFTQSDVTAVPEPATLSLFALGLAGLGFARRRNASRRT